MRYAELLSEKSLWGLLLVALVAMASACSRDQSATHDENPPAHNNTPTPFANVTTDRIRDAGIGAEWLSYGGNYDEQRHSPLTKVDRDNVNGLGVAWTFELKTNRGVEATPLVVDGVMYATSAWSVVHAVDAKTGESLWTYDPQVDKRVGVKACCDVVNRGVAVFEGQVFVGVLDGRLEALDAQSGDLQWSVVTVDQSKPYTITGAPRVVDGKVLIGNGGSELGVRGYLSAYDASSGELVWRFYTVPNPEKAPDNAASDPIFATAANDSWGDQGDWVSDGGGGTVWDAIVYDAENDAVVFGVGNGSPWNQTMRDPAGGDNLFLSSIVSVDADTGAYRWHYQTTPGDNWDYTATQTIILASLPLGENGADRRVVMQAPKNGFFYVLDAATGEFISGEAFVPMDWASGLDSTGRPIEVEGARYGEEPVLIAPGPMGAHNWHPMAFNPELNLAYIPAQEIPAAYASDPRANEGTTWNTGADFSAGVPIEISRADISVQRALLKGRLIAWDPITQSPRWSVEHENAWNGGILSTAGGLVFQGKLNGEFVAYDAADGTRLWMHDLRSGGASGPMTYEIDGEQYVAITSGWGSLYAMGNGFAYDETVPSSLGKIVTFKLGGKSVIPEPELVAIDRTPKAEPFGDEDQVAAGMVHFQRNCAVCHGNFAIGSGVLPDLRWSGIAASQEAWRSVVVDGILADNGMVSFSAHLSEEDVESIRAYVLVQANNAAREAAEPYEKKSIEVSSIKQGWTATGLWLQAGDEVTLAGVGLADLGIGHPLEPRHLIWARIGENGPIFQVRSNHYSFEAGKHGELYLSPSPVGLFWANRRGDRIPQYADVPEIPLALSVTAYRWRDTAKEGLERLLADTTLNDTAKSALMAIEQERELPTGFDYLWYLNASNVFAAYTADGRKGVHVETSDDFGIIRKPLNIPLTADTRIDFDWLYESIPAVAAENTPATHDYMSIAVEFDNGQDITWFWSKNMPEGESFPCPLPDWQHRETHIVLQSGEQGLGEWHSHSRPILEDYASSVGGEPPERIVGVWIIGASVFNRQLAEAYFANATIVDGENRTDVFD